MASLSGNNSVPASYYFNSIVSKVVAEYPPKDCLPEEWSFMFSDLPAERIESYATLAVDAIARWLGGSHELPRDEKDILMNLHQKTMRPHWEDTIVDYGTLENFSLHEWNLQLNVGLTGAFLCSKIFGFKMSLDDKGGVILNIASDLSVIAPNHSIYNKGTYKPVMYSVVKHGLIGLTKYISTYWNNQKIRCNAISPGPIKTDQPKSFVNRSQAWLIACSLK